MNRVKSIRIVELLAAASMGANVAALVALYYSEAASWAVWLALLS